MVKIWDTYRFTFGKGSSFWVWQAEPFSCVGYHYSVPPEELDEDELATLCHTFFARLLFDRVVVGLDGGDSAASQSAYPLSSCWFKMRCSSLCLNMKNMFSFPMWKRISPLPTSILALAALRNCRPMMSSIPRSPYISMTTKSTRTKESRTPYIPNCRVCELHTHICWGESRV